MENSQAAGGVGQLRVETCGMPTAPGIWSANALRKAVIRDPLRPFDGSEGWVSEFRRQERELQARFGQRMLYITIKACSEPGNVGATAQVLRNARLAKMNPLL